MTNLGGVLKRKFVFNYHSDKFQSKYSSTWTIQAVVVIWGHALTKNIIQALQDENPARAEKLKF